MQFFYVNFKVSMSDITEWLKYPFWLRCNSSRLGAERFASLSRCEENRSDYLSCMSNVGYV